MKINVISIMKTYSDDFMALILHDRLYINIKNVMVCKYRIKLLFIHDFVCLRVYCHESAVPDGTDLFAMKKPVYWRTN